MLCTVILLSLLSGCGGETDTPQEPQTGNQETMRDVEIQKAIDLGLVPEALQGDYDAQISYAEFCSILDNFTSVMFPDALSSWEDASANYRDADDLMSRMEGALVLLYAAECSDIDAVGYEYNIPLEDLIAGDVDFYEGVTWDYPLLPDITQIYYDETIANSEHYSWRCEQDYFDNAKRFVEYMSYGNGKTFFDYDERYSLNLGRPFTRGAAIRAVERLYENAKFAQYVPADQVSCTVSEATIAQGLGMPVVSWQQLPDWKGYTIPMGLWLSHYGNSMAYEKENVEVLGDLRFNFVRVPLDSRTIFKGSDMSMVNPAYLETMDDLVEYCAEAGIHVCFDLHDMPGFYTGGDDSKITLWDDEETQELFVTFWRFLAEYYKDVPPNLLSFNLLNEPHDAYGTLSDEVYSEVMLKAIAAIREVTPERLIFADTLGVIQGVPVQGLKDAQVVQTVHPYFLKDGTPAWPAYDINGFIHRNNGVLTINGTFPAGTTISANIESVHFDSVFFLNANGTTITTMELGTESVGENGCIAIGEEGTGGEYRHYEGVLFEGVLPQSCQQITLTQENGWWYNLKSLKITTDTYSVTITADPSAVPDETAPILSISANSKVSSQNGSTLICKSREWLENIFQSYQDFTEKTGTQIMVHEFGFNESIDYEATLAAADDFLSVLADYDIPWCSWCSNFGPVMDNREYEWYSQLWGVPLKRDGAEYKMVSENWMIDTGLMEVYQKYMDK